MTNEFHCLLLGKRRRARLRGALARAALVGCLLPPTVLAAQPPEALQKAVALVQEGRLEEADRELQRALSDPETRPVALSILGTIRLQQERLDEGAELLEEAIRLEPGLVGAQLTLAQVYAVKGREEQAVEVFRRVLELDPANATARMALASAEATRGNYAKSLELARPALAAFEESPEGLFILATDYLKTGDRAAAARLVEKWKGLGRVSHAVSARFAQLLAEGGLPGQAIDLLEHIQRMAGPFYDVMFALGAAHLLNEDPGRALEAYDRALASRPNSVPALRQAAAVAERRGELERSLSYWLRARKIERDDPEILLGFGRVCLKMDLLEDAETALAQAARLRPDETPYQYALAVAKAGKKQHEEAQALLEPLVEKRPDDARLLYALGSVLYIQGHLEEAASRLRASLRLEPEQLASPYYLALIARDQGRDAEAIEGLMALLGRYPDHAPSCEVLGGLLLNERRYAEAEAYLRRALHFNPGSMKANYQLGLLLARTGRRQEATRHLELASTLREEDEEASRTQLRLLDPAL